MSLNVKFECEIERPCAEFLTLSPVLGQSGPTGRGHDARRIEDLHESEPSEPEF